MMLVIESFKMSVIWIFLPEEPLPAFIMLIYLNSLCSHSILDGLLTRQQAATKTKVKYRVDEWVDELNMYLKKNLAFSQQNVRPR